MRAGNMLVFSPGFRQVWKLRFDAVPLLVLVLILSLALTVMGTFGYMAPLLSNIDDEHSSRLFVENGTLAIENRAAELQLQKLAERARELEQQTSRIAAELAE
jgi:hypothetical protein